MMMIQRKRASVQAVRTDEYEEWNDEVTGNEEIE